MRKTILKITLGGALAIMAATGVQMASSNKTASNLLMQNAEALASGEEATSKKFKCYSILEGSSGQSIACSTCNLETGIPPWYHFGDYCTR